MIHEQMPQLPLRDVGNRRATLLDSGLLGSAVGCFSSVDGIVRIAATHLDFTHTLDLAP